MNNNESKKMENSTTNLHPVNKNKCINLLNSYIPTNERQWNYVIPIVGVSLSCFSFGLFCSFLQEAWFYRSEKDIYPFFGYLILSGAVGIELYYGLTHRNRKQFSFWIILKVLELFLMSSGLVLYLLQYRPLGGLVALGIFILLLNTLLVTYVIKRSLKPQRKTIENIYEVPHAQQYCNVSVY